MKQNIWIWLDNGVIEMYTKDEIEIIINSTVRKIANKNYEEYYKQIASLVQARANKDLILDISTIVYDYFHHNLKQIITESLYEILNNE